MVDLQSAYFVFTSLRPWTDHDYPSTKMASIYASKLQHNDEKQINIPKHPHNSFTDTAESYNPNNSSFHGRRHD